MAERKISIWASGLAINLVSNGISIIVGAIVTYLSHDGSTWVKPVLAGGFAWLITFCSLLAIRISRNLPTKETPMDTSNVQQRIRNWLDRYNMTVKSVNDPDTYFFFIVTTDGGNKVAILRTKNQFSDYVEVRGVILASDQEKAVLAKFSDEEKTSVRLAIKLELARSVMGYKADKDVLEEVSIFKRVPITPSLNEEEIFKLVWEVEAMLNTLFVVGATANHKHELKEKELNGGTGIH
jgi:Uncharacterized conserved protein (DUF2299)